MTAPTGTPMALLKDFKLATGAYHVRDPKVVNLAGRHRYLWHKIFYNAGKKAIQGGSEVDFSYMLTDGGTFQESLPAQFRQWKRIDNALRASLPWRSWFDHKVWTREELMKNSRFRYGNRAQKFDVLFDLDMQKEQRMQTSLANGLEDQLGATPHFSLMADTTRIDGTKPLSFFAHINEDAYGLYGEYFRNDSDTSASIANLVGGAWTQKQGMNPKATDAGGTIQRASTTRTGKIIDSKLAPNVVNYVNDTPNNTGNIFGALREAYRKVQWTGPENVRQWFENSELNSLRALASNDALRMLETLILEGQDRFIVGPQDPGVPMPQIYGIPILWWPILDTAPVYSSGHDANGVPTAKTTELAVTGTTNPGAGAGGRIYMCNFNVLYPVCHDEMWMYRETMDPHFNVPDVFVEYTEGWHNWVCEDYRQHAIVSPVGNRVTT